MQPMLFRQETVQPRYSGIGDVMNARAERSGCYHSFVGDGKIRGPRAHDGDLARHRGSLAGAEHDDAGGLVVGGFSYYQRAEVKDILAYLKLAVSQTDSLSLLRIVNNPARGIGRTTMEQIEQYALENNLTLWNAIGAVLQSGQLATRAHAAMAAFKNVIEDLADAVARLPLNEALKFIEERTGYRAMLEKENTTESQSRLENLEELANAAAEAVERGETITEFLDHTALVADSDSLEEGAQVTLRPPTEADVPELARIRTTEEVHRWWRGGEDMTKAVADDLAQPDVET